MRLHFLLPFLLAVGLYAVNIPGTYIYDDVEIARKDARLHDPHQWGDYWREGYFEDGLDNIWRPLVSLSMAVQAWAHPNHASPFHLVNVLLHAAASGMVALLAARLADRRVGLLAGLLFAAHPVHVEAVAGIVGRAEIMTTLGILGALLLFLDRPMTVARALAITGCFLFAALCKEQGLLIPLMLLAANLIFRRPRAVLQATGQDLPQPTGPVLMYAHGRAQTTSPEQKRANLWLAFLLTSTLAAYISYRNSILPWYWERSFLDQAINPLIKSIGADRWLIPVAILGRYAALLVFPHRLLIDYSAGVFTSRLNWHEPFFYIGASALIAVLVLLVLAWKNRWNTIAFCLVCFALVYLLVGNLLLIGTIFGERLMYVPSVFFCILVAIALAKLPTRVFIPAVSVVLSLASLRTVTYAWQWNDVMRLYNYEYAIEPRAANINLLLADEEQKRGNLARADEILQNARRLAPQSWEVWRRSALLALKLNRPADAFEFAHQAMRIHPSSITAGLYGDAADALAAATSQPSTHPTTNR